jgi:hypothetical protein
VKKWNEEKRRLRGEIMVWGESRRKDIKCKREIPNTDEQNKNKKRGKQKDGMERREVEG